MIAKPKPRSAPDAAPSDLRSAENRLNRTIIDLLERDGRMPFSEIAQALGVSEGTVRNRVAGMKASGALRIVAMADPGAVEYQADALVGIKVAAGHTPEAVAARLGAHESIVYILWVAGRHDLIVEIVSDSRDDFLALLETEIHGRDDIAEAEVMLGLKNFKNQFLLKAGWPGRTP